MNNYRFFSAKLKLNVWFLPLVLKLLARFHRACKRPKLLVEIKWLRTKFDSQNRGSTHYWSDFMPTDIRWKLRLQNYEMALKQLEDAVNLAQSRELSDLEKQGLIQSFEYTHELAWNTLKDFLFDQGHSSIAGSKDTTREAFKVSLIQQGEIWMDMIQSRNQTSHTYNKATANLITSKILKDYFPLFLALKKELSTRATQS